jgi:hypothetical protein
MQGLRRHGWSIDPSFVRELEKENYFADIFV